MDNLPTESMSVIVRPLPWSAISTAQWDGFAGSCGAAHRGAMGYLRFLRLRKSVRLFEMFYSIDGTEAKFGQCAVSVGPVRHFVGGLQLLPGPGPEWAVAMAAVLKSLGPGRYQYGSTWDLEGGRDDVLREMDGVVVEDVQPHVMQAVEFARWPNWDAYCADVSKNARRNARSAERSFPDLSLTTARGLRTAEKVQRLTWMRGLMCRRKRLAFNFGREWLRSLLRSLLWRRHAVIASFHAGRKTIAMLSCIEFGANTYYLEAASRAANQGAAWYLMLFMLRRAYDRAPQGRFVMGVVVDDSDLNWSREQCRVSGIAISTVFFAYTPPQGAVGFSQG